jgi:hypothetical protein
MAVRLSALRAAALYSPERFLVLISVRGSVDSRAIVRLEGLVKLKKKIHLIGTRTRELPAYDIVPPHFILCLIEYTLYVKLFQVEYISLNDM